MTDEERRHQMNKKALNKMIIAAVVMIVIAVFMIFDLGQYLSLSHIRESREKFQLLY